MSTTIKHAIIVCHPSEQSFTMSLARKYEEVVREKGHETVFRDLYRLKFNPVLGERERHGHPRKDVGKEWGALGKPDVFVLVYPIWFGTPPATLTGYIERVFGAGRETGTMDEGGSGELLEGKRLVSLTCSGSMRAWLDEKGVLGSLRNVYDRYLTDVFGFAETARYHFDGITPEMDEHTASQHLFDAGQAAEEVVRRLTGEWTMPVSGWIRNTRIDWPEE